MKKMFGGLCYLLKGNMLCGIVDDKLMLRVDPEDYEDSLKQKHVREMDFTGRPLMGMIYVLPEGIKTKASLSRWIDKSYQFIRLFPAKKK